VHAENGDAVAEGQRRVFEAGITGPEGHALSRPAGLEAEATGRAIRLAEFVGVPLYVVHVMSAGAAEEVGLVVLQGGMWRRAALGAGGGGARRAGCSARRGGPHAAARRPPPAPRPAGHPPNISPLPPRRQVARARQRGQRVIGEPVASGLALNESWLWHPDFRTAAQYVMSPPIRSAEDGAALRRALAGGALQIVATDHAVFNSTQKAVGRRDFRIIPNGVNGIEERLHVVWEEMVNSGAAAG
jgi:dihydroorotase-like cyclic amidohydrolase